jgi:ATP-dependent Clp protease ATP-binding subunit ClpA
MSGLASIWAFVRFTGHKASHTIWLADRQTPCGSEDITEDELNDQDQHQERIRALLCEAKSKDTGIALFRPNFVGRVDELYVCKDLDKGVTLKILEKEIGKINRD